MRAIVKYLGRVLSVLWQLPQDLVGAVVYAYLRWRAWMDKDSRYLEEPLKHGITAVSSDYFSGGMSLGHFIFTVAYVSSDFRVHEYGHCMQSRLLGWLYLPVIGIPSLLWATLHTYTPLYRRNYYAFYTEAWADRLGGVKR